MQFLNPALLAGALLFAVPLLIHLLNRQRHKRRPWAAMEFLLRAYQKQRNRLRNENLLLLLLRCLIPVLLALAIARPVLREAVALLTGGGTVHHVFVLDASYSTGASPDGAPSPFEHARTMVGRLLDRFEANPNRNDKVTMVLAGTRPRFLVRGNLDLGAARNAWLSTLKPDDAAGDLGDALHQVADALDESTDASTQVYVFSDLQRQSFGDDTLPTPATDDDPQLTETLRDTVQRLTDRDGTQLHWIDTGPIASGDGGRVDNVQITDLRLSDPTAVQKAPAEAIATLRNVGAATRTAEVTLEIDGGEPMRKLIEIPPGAESEADFQLSFRTPGHHRLRASLVFDALRADDERFLTVDVRDRIRILLVDGRASAEPLLSYDALWRAMLDPDPDLLPTFAVETVDLLTLLGGQCRPQDFDVVVLADVDRLNGTATALLGDALRAGRGLLVQFGANCDPDSFNLHLYDGGNGPMPYRLLAPVGGAQGSSTVRAPSIVVEQHGILAEFEEDIYREILQAIPLWRWFTIAPDSLTDGARVILQVTDAARTPLLTANEYGEGRAVFLNSPIASEFDADRWNRLDDPLVAFALLHGMTRWLALPAGDPFSVEVGGELGCSVAARPIDLQIERPERDGRPRTSPGGDARALPGGRFQLPSFRDTRFAGFYECSMTLDHDTDRQPLRLPFAVNVAPAEGELTYASRSEAAQALGIERVLDSLPVAASADDDPDRSEFGPSLLLLTLLFVLGEAALARYVAVRRS